MSYVWPFIAYLVGSVPMAIVVARIFRLPDPRTTGSHNPGTTNILRYGGKVAAAATLAGDVLKGVFVIAVVQVAAPDPIVLALSGLGVFLGHLYPVFFRFQGGKGVATALGVWLVLVPWVGLMLLATWITVAAAFRFSSLAALAAACLAPIYVLWLAPSGAYIALSLVMTALLVWRHRTNIRKLLSGTEGQIGAR
jgi:glycerol-3-phosphate acyltransferase PlsY